jgi:hypothetical protein
MPFTFKNICSSCVIWLVSHSLCIYFLDLQNSNMKVMPPFFSENVIAIALKFIWMARTSFAIMRLFFHKVFIIFNTLLSVLSNMLHIYKCCKIPYLEFRAHHKNLVSVCYLQNGIHIVPYLQGETHGSWRVPDLR